MIGVVKITKSGLKVGQKVIGQSLGDKGALAALGNATKGMFGASMMIKSPAAMKTKTMNLLRKASRNFRGF